MGGKEGQIFILDFVPSERTGGFPEIGNRYQQLVIRYVAYL